MKTFCELAGECRARVSNSRGQFRWLTYLAAALLVAPLVPTSGRAGEASSATNEITATSILADMRYEKVVAAHLLAFTSREDKRPWYVDDALLVLELPKGQWMLLHAVRNPRYPPKLKRNPSPWMAHFVYDAPYVGDRTFNHRPTRSEMDKFLKDNEWQPASDKYWRVVRSAVDEAVWLKVLGFHSPWFKASTPSGTKKG